MKNLILLTFSSFFAISHCQAQKCSDDSDNLINGRCYKLVTQQLTYSDARGFCHQADPGYTLATVLDKSTANVLSVLAHSVFNSSNGGQFWIGLSRNSTGSPWTWDDKSSFGWSNFGTQLGQNYVAQSSTNSKWGTFGSTDKNYFVCSYDPASVPTTAKPLSSVTCLIMYDTQSLGIDQNAINSYKAYFNFAHLVASKLNDKTMLTGYIDNYGYSAGLNDHQNYPTDDFFDLRGIPFPIDGTDDDIDLDLKDVDGSLAAASWTPPVTDQTCMIFISAAPEAEYGGTTIKSTYSSFGTVVGVLVGGATSIPGLSIDTNVIAAPALSDSDADAVVSKLLELLL